MTDDAYDELNHESEQIPWKQLANGGYVGRQMANRYVHNFVSEAHDVCTWLNIPREWGLDINGSLFSRPTRPFDGSYHRFYGGGPVSVWPGGWRSDSD